MKSEWRVLNDCQILKLKIFSNLQRNEHIHLFFSLLFVAFHKIWFDRQKSTKMNPSLLKRMETLVYLYMNRVCYWGTLWIEFVLNSEHINLRFITCISGSAICVMCWRWNCVFLVNEFQLLNCKFHSLQFR